jgi:hypothetical protein
MAPFIRMKVMLRFQRTPDVARQGKKVMPEIQMAVSLMKKHPARACQMAALRFLMLETRILDEP